MSFRHYPAVSRTAMGGTEVVAILRREAAR